MSLSTRLNEVIETVMPCKVACDTGCDHGFVSIELVKRQVADRVIACDINKGPLEAAKKNIEAAGLSEKIETRLSDGLHNTTSEDGIQCLIVAGMGGALMTKILSEGKDRLNSATQLVLQPQSEIFLVRKWLRDNGYYIFREKMFTDMGKLYCIIDGRCGQAETVLPEIQEIFDTYSGYLISQKDSTLKEYLIKSIEVSSGYLEGIEDSKRDGLMEKIGMMKKALSMMEQ